MAEKKASLRKLNQLQLEEANLDTPGRTIKMVMPVCSTCQHGKVPDNWAERCPHDPYYATTAIPHEEPPPVEEILDPEGKGTGRFKITGEPEVWYEYKKELNFTQVPFNIRIDSRRGVQMGQAGGFKFVEDFGVAPFCQYRGCWSQELTVRHPQYGNYCSEMHAKLVVADTLGIPIQQDSDRLQEQLAKIAL